MKALSESQLIVGILNANGISNEEEDGGVLSFTWEGTRYSIEESSYLVDVVLYNSSVSVARFNLGEFTWKGFMDQLKEELQEDLSQYHGPYAD